jgi:hypothetical protein
MAHEPLNDTENAERMLQFAFKLDPNGDFHIARRSHHRRRACR